MKYTELGIFIDHTFKLLEHTKSNEPDFLCQMQIQMIEYGLNDTIVTIRMKKKEVVLIPYSFTPTNMNFQTILMPKVILANFCYIKNWSVGTKYILAFYSRCCCRKKSVWWQFTICNTSRRFPIEYIIFGYQKSMALLEIETLGQV